MSRNFKIFVGLLLISTVYGGERPIGLQDVERKEPEKKPNIVKDYVCLRDGELCHPNYLSNRGLYVSCSHGVAWEQQCPPCSYHPITCPTKTLWFDGEKCEWASPKLVSMPCIDRIPTYDIQSINGTVKDISILPIEQDSLIKNLEAVNPSPVAQMQIASVSSNSFKDHVHIQAEKGKWPLVNVNTISLPAQPTNYKAPKSAELEKDLQEIESIQEYQDNEVKYQEEEDDEEEKSQSVTEEKKEGEQDALNQKKRYSTLSRRKSVPEPIAEDEDKILKKELSTYFPTDDDTVGSKIRKIQETVFGLVDSQDGSGKKMLMKISKPFVYEDDARSILSIINPPEF